MYIRPAYLWRTLDDGRRQVSWRTWLLIWIAPGLFLLAAAGMLGLAAYGAVASVPGKGEVVRVYSWPGETMFDRGQTNYSPVFRYIWSDGAHTEASTGMSHPNWNFAIGSQHDIRYFPSRKANVILPGPHNAAAGWIILLIGVVCSVPALAANWAVRRWLRGGAPVRNGN